MCYQVLTPWTAWCKVPVGFAAFVEVQVGDASGVVTVSLNEEQKGIAEASKEAVDATDLWEDPIITTIEPLTNYYVAENYHQDYFENNPTAGYCSFVIAPKVQKFKKEFAHLLKEDIS